MRMNLSSRRRAIIFALLAALSAGVLPSFSAAQTPASPATSPASADPVLAQIREEGLQRSQVMQTLNYLANVIGPRLTGSPNCKKANDWTRDQLTAFGLSNAHLESWPFNGRGWFIKRFHLEVIEPEQISPICYPKAWSPGLDKPLTAPVVFLDARTEEDLQKYRGKLKGAIVLNGGIRPIGPVFTPEAVRLSDADIERIAKAPAGVNLDTQPLRATTGPGRGRGRGPQSLSRGRVLSFLMEEGAVMELTASTSSEMGILVGAGTASLPATGNAPTGRGGPTAYSLNAPATLPQVTVSAEHYNRLVRMAQLGVPMTIETEFQAQFTADDTNAYNTIAEIPGTDLKDQVVMLGGHLDSWHMGTGATDNGTGVAVCMEAVRIIQALHIHPRRTIRIGLWTGEEEGLLGSRAYVRDHFGTSGRELAAGRGRGATQPAADTLAPPPPAPVYLPEHARFSIYFNTDEGGGKFRGLFAGDNPPAAELLQKWIAPFADLGSGTITRAHASSTDHVSFEGVGLPAAHFLQDPIDYWAGTWHTSQDLYDHVVAEDMKVNAVIMAACVYQAAMADELMPRKSR